ncbi:MAG: T9SS type A sorting domain-containing protein [Bacteroidota bacterium]
MNEKLQNVKVLNQYLVLAFFVVFILGYGTAQTLQRQCIGSGGTFMVDNGVLIQQTVGQPYATNTNYSDGITYRPGFQQPIFKIKLIHSTISLNVFPNPATSWVTLQCDNILKDVIIRVVDIAGKLLIEEKIAEFKSYTLNCEDWINGTYLITASDSQNNSYSSKLMILK